MKDLIEGIESGKTADLIVRNRDPMTIRDPKELLEMRPLYTIIDGRIAYRY